VTYAAEQRSKEIGIRKVLGASIAHLVGLLSKDFFKACIPCRVYGFSVSLVGMSKWLESFAYRTNIGWWGLCYSRQHRCGHNPSPRSVSAPLDRPWQTGE